MKHKQNWQKFIDTTCNESELFSIYRKLRHSFQKRGWTQQDLENPPSYPQDIMNYYQIISNLISDLRSEIKSYFGDIDNDEFTDYLESKLKQIDLETPLQDGNIKRNNSRDEDN